MKISEKQEQAAGLVNLPIQCVRRQQATTNPEAWNSVMKLVSHAIAEQRYADRIPAANGINEFIGLLRYSSVLTKQQKRTLKGQALAGDLDGAKRGYEKILTRARRKVCKQCDRFNGVRCTNGESQNETV